MSQMAMQSDGRIMGIDGMLDQVTDAMTRQVKTHILPVVQSDERLQRNLARGLGEGLGDKVKTPLMVVGIAALVFAGAYAYKNVGRKR